MELHLRLTRKGALSIAIMVLLVVSVIGYVVWPRAENDLGSALQPIAQKMAFPIYYPSPLPSGYVFKPTSLSVSSGIVVFALQNGKASIAFTEQAKPLSFDFNQLSGTDEFRTPLGQAYILDFQSRTTGSVVTNKTWIVVNAMPAIGADKMREILNTLTSID